MADNKTLEDKLMSFYTHYQCLNTMVNLYTNIILSDDCDQITRQEIDFMFESIREKMEGQLTSLSNILDEFQTDYSEKN